MRCLQCNTELEDKLTNYIADFGQCVIVIRTVPAQVCPKCEEKSYSYNVSVRLQEIINEVRTLVTGIAEINFTTVAQPNIILLNHLYAITKLINRKEGLKCQ